MTMSSTRTRKVRRNFIAEKYAVLIEALYGGKTEQFIETQVKFEDGARAASAPRCKFWKGRSCGHPPSGLTEGAHDRRCFRPPAPRPPRAPQRFLSPDCPRKI